MKRALAAVAFASMVLGGCTCLDLETPRAYPCDYEAADPAQCPAGYRCGLEDRCHEVGAAGPWQCTSDEHCEAAWRCGPQGTCLDPATEALRPTGPASFSATRVGPPLPLQLPTLVEAADNFQVAMPTCSQWATPAPNLPDGGYDGEAPPWFWVYGRAATLVYPDRLRKVFDWSGDVVRLPDGGAPMPEDCDGGSGVKLQEVTMGILDAPPPPGTPVAMADRGFATYVVTAEGSLCVYSLDGGPSLDRRCQRVFASELEPAAARFPRSRWGGDGEFLVAYSPNGYQLYSTTTGTVSPMGQVTQTDGGVIGINDLIAYPTDMEPMLLAATDAGLYVRGAFGLRPSDGGTLGLSEWEPVGMGWDLPCEVSPDRAYSDTRPVDLTWADQYGSTLAVTVSRSYDRGNGERVSYESVLVFPPLRADAGMEGWNNKYEACRYPPAESWGTWEGGQYEYFARSEKYCQPCIENERITYVHLREEEPYDGYVPGSSPPYKIEARCASSDGGVTAAVNADGTCRAGDGKEGDFIQDVLPSSARFHRPIRASRGVFPRAVADDLGHLWLGGYYWALQGVTLDAAPTTVFEGVRGLTATRASETAGRVLDQPVLLGRPEAYDELPEGYVEATIGEIPTVSGVDGEPTWVLVDFSLGGSQQILGAFEIREGVRDGGETPVRAIARIPEQYLFGEPYLGAASVTATGRNLLLMTSFDALLAVDVTEQLQRVPQGEFNPTEFFESPEPDVKLIALNRTPITSLALLDPAPTADGGHLVEGYLLQAARVFHFYAPNFTVWRSNEIVLEDETEPKAVLVDGRRARVGMLNGAVYSLPSRLLLADPLPASAGKVSDYLQHCGNLFALGDDGVYWLQVGTEPKGTWQAIPIPEGVLPASARNFKGGRLYGRGNELRVYTAHGLVVRVGGFTCQ